MSNDAFFEECLSGVKHSMHVLYREDKEKIFHIFYAMFPWHIPGDFVWDTSQSQEALEEAYQPANIISVLRQLLRKKHIDAPIYVLWDDAGLPVIQVDFFAAL